MKDKTVGFGEVKQEQQTVSNPRDAVVIRDAIELFFNEMIAECSGSD